MSQLSSHYLFSDANLVAYYQFEGSSADSKGSNTGTDTAITYNMASGRFGQGASFNGTTSKIALTTEQTATVGTFSCWFKVTSAAVLGLYSQGKSAGGDTDRIHFEINAGKLKLTTVQSSTTTTSVATNALFNDNLWHHGVITVDDAGNKLFVDGAQQAVTYTNGSASTSVWFGDISSVTDTKDIGTLNINGVFFNFFSGTMDEVAIFSRALTLGEIQSLYNANHLSDFQRPSRPAPFKPGIAR